MSTEVTRERLVALAAQVTESEQRPRGSSGASFALDEFISKHGIAVTRESDKDGVHFWHLAQCIFNSHHGGTSVVLMRLANAAIVYKCQHASCSDKKWQDVREHFEPGCYDVPDFKVAAVRNDFGQLLALKSSGTPLDGSVVLNAPTVPQFLAQSDSDEEKVLAGGLVTRSGISLLASPRGVGKTIVALKVAIELERGGEFCSETLPNSRVLFCAYENSPALLRDRLKRLGGAESDNLQILTRSKAPKLQSDEWRAFPVERFDFIIVDSLSPALEGGIDERQGGQNSDALAALLDIVQRGPGVLLVANTTKTGSSIRGSGILSDRADLVFEVRDATDFKPNLKQEVWWDGLVENQGEDGWAGRARRRRGKTVFRLALIPSKTRIGPELDPRVVELSLPADEPWTITDVTADVASAHERSKSEAVEKRQAREDAAATALKSALPISKAEAEELLMQNHVSRKGARQLIKDRTSVDRTVAGAGTKVDPYILTRIDGENPEAIIANGDSNFVRPILAAPLRQHGEHFVFENPSAPMGVEAENARRGATRIYPGKPSGKQFQSFEDLE